MATTSFTDNFKFTAKTSLKLVEALSRSKQVDVKMKHEVESIHDVKEIDNLIDSMTLNRK